MLSPKALEAWYTLMAEATRGSAQAQEAFQSLSKMSGSPDDMNRWMAQFMPGVASTTRFTPDAFEDQLEDWWRLMGVVPRARYLDLLEKCDTLQRKLDKAEETIENLRKRVSGSSSQPGGEETKQVLDMWSSMMGETLKTQTEWMKAWTAANTGTDDPEGEESADEADRAAK